MWTKETWTFLAKWFLIISVVVILANTVALLITTGGISPQTGMTVGFAMMSLGLFFSNQALSSKT